MTRAEKKRAKLGRRCRWCDVTDGAVAWSTNMRECAACQRQRLRSKCGRCGGPRWSSSGCIKCDPRPLPGTVEVVVVHRDGSEERVRRVRRKGGLALRGQMIPGRAAVRGVVVEATGGRRIGR